MSSASSPVRASPVRVDAKAMPRTTPHRDVSSAPPGGPSVRAPSLPLLRVANDSATRPDAPALTATGHAAPAANADTRSSDPLQALVPQIQALLAELCPLEPPAFGLSITALEIAWPALSRADARGVLRALKALPPACQVPPRQQLLRAALYDLTRSAAAERLLQEQIAHHAKKEQAHALPGAVKRSATSGSVGGAVGAVGVVDVRAGMGLRSTTSTETADDLSIATFHTTTVHGEVSAQAQLAGVVGVKGALTGSHTHGNADIAVSLNDHVLALARASTARKLGGPTLLRAFRRITQPGRDRYTERIGRAMAWQSRLPLLLGAAVPSAEAVSRLPVPAPITATLSAFDGSLSASATLGPGQLALSLEASRTTLESALPTRLTTLKNGACPASCDAPLRDALDARVAALLDNAKPLRSRTLQQVLAIRRSTTGQALLTQRLDAAAQLRAEFNHLEALARHAHTAPRQALPALKSLARDWGAGADAVDTVMIRMLDTLAWLQATPATAGASERAAWTQLQTGVEALATRIHDTDVARDRVAVHAATHGFRNMTQQIDTLRGALEVSTHAVPLLTAAVRVAVAQHTRQDPEPLRDGRYLELTLGVRFGWAVGRILGEVQRMLPVEWADLPLGEVGDLMQGLTEDVFSMGTAQCLLRFFRPSFQDESNFPPQARGAHLQAFRLSTGTERDIGFNVPLPLVPGIAATVSLHHNEMTQRTRHERLFAGTLTGILLRYQSLCAAGKTHADTWAGLIRTHQRDLDHLAGALGDPGSVPAGEARFWLRRNDADADMKVLHAVGRAEDGVARRERLFELFEALLGVTQGVKAASPLVGPLTLSSPAGR